MTDTPALFLAMLRHWPGDSPHPWFIECLWLDRNNDFRALRLMTGKGETSEVANLVYDDLAEVTLDSWAHIGQGTRDSTLRSIRVRVGPVGGNDRHALPVLPPDWRKNGMHVQLEDAAGHQSGWVEVVPVLGSKFHAPATQEDILRQFQLELDKEIESRKTRGRAGERNAPG